VFPEHLGARVTEDPFGGGVPLHDAEVGIPLDDGNGALMDELRQALLRGAQGIRRPVQLLGGAAQTHHLRPQLCFRIRRIVQGRSTSEARIGR